MDNKFKMELVWHNCFLYPPAEDINHDLIATDGVNVFHIAYNKDLGWLNVKANSFLSDDLLLNYWWADIKQTVKECIDF